MSDTARRVTIWQSTADLADTLLQGDDMLCHLDAHERVVRLSACVGDIASDVVENACGDLEACLLRLLAEAQLALESLLREQAAA